jgi:hypothetical protein
MELYDDIKNVLLDIYAIGKDKFVIITGGIGDFLTIDYFFSFSEKHNIIFITTQSLKLKTILQFYNKTNKFYSLNFAFSLIGKPGFDNTDEMLDFFPELKNIKTINISEYFPLIRNLINSKKVTGYNMFLNKTIINIKKKFNIPDRFALIHPYTEDNRIHCIKCKKVHKGIQKCGLTRNFVDKDYSNIFNFLKKQNIIGVIISIKPIIIPNIYEGIQIINLSYNMIDIIDCIELTKQCNYFFGVDSVFSVIASRILPCQNIYIKCNNKHGDIYKELYWYPFKNINYGPFINIKY